MNLQGFPRFYDLPAELRIQIWREACPTPGIHAFDVCIPSPQTGLRIFQARAEVKGEDVHMQFEPPTSVFLDQVVVPQTKNKPVPQSDSNKRDQSTCRNANTKCSLTSDPSAYLLTDSIAQSCPEASSSFNPPASSNRSSTTNTKINTVNLPIRGPKGKQIHYNNLTDTLHLRFGPSVLANTPFDPWFLNPYDGSEDAYIRVFKGSLSDILLYPWSTELTGTLQSARRIAIDIADLQMEMAPTHAFALEAIYQEVECLVARFAKGLEVLYAVDYCMGQCRRCETAGVKVRGDLTRKLDYIAGEREPDVIYGNGATYSEVYDLEALGWSEETPAFIVLKMFAEAIGKQQREEGKGEVCFQGVRVLACRQSEI
ncbi:uncharacterized protein DSM5745_06283 [Aspergillus mulundensis]|uniref:2EXR domain-containing protein n=1 Tax=Aspergillus mulundensis TaxID=1810919 RepID=A0A3D8RR68_9EURO|nr:Uncharacterized protein DSM5745_06283 [Aspergillus mulundensis]RDW76291.1 Uncharacterized protein DSM5745_06283 [Aspergillus mulundensis]